jgi:hypothetical protein
VAAPAPVLPAESAAADQGSGDGAPVGDTAPTVTTTGTDAASALSDALSSSVSRAFSRHEWARPGDALDAGSPRSIAMVVVLLVAVVVFLGFQRRIRPRDTRLVAAGGGVQGVARFR